MRAFFINLQAPMQNDEPLIWTTKGNVPASDLHFETYWEKTEDYVKCMPTYFLKETGEEVKRDCFILALKPFLTEVIQGSFS